MSLTGLKPSRSMNIRTSRGALRPRVGGARRARQRLLEAVGEQDAVGQAGQRVAQRQPREPPLGALALDARSASPWSASRPVDVVLVEVVLRAGLHGLERDLLVVDARQHDDRDVRRGGAQPAHAVDPGRVRQRQVEQDEVGEAAADGLDGVLRGG